MKCPWCSREIGFPSPNRSSAQCPYCNRGYTYAFRGRTFVKYLIPTIFIAWLLAPYFDIGIILVIFIFPFIVSVYLEKWF